MTHDKQLRGITLELVIDKRRLDQALNAKEFAVLAGISYSAARAWFRLPGFPVVQGVVFWSDFVKWRTARHASPHVVASLQETALGPLRSIAKRTMDLPPRAAQILAQAG